MKEALIGIATMAIFVLVILYLNSYVGFSNMLRPAATPASTLATA